MRSRRNMLEGVPRVGFFKGGPRPPMETPFPSCVRAWMEWENAPHPYRRLVGPNDDWHNLYTNLMGASGAAFRTVWNDAEWNADTTDIIFMDDDPFRPHRRTLAAAGYGCDILAKDSFMRLVHADGGRAFGEGEFRERIIAEIDAGRPVVGFGVAGPPEACLISGYDEGGEVLIGWSYFQDNAEFSPNPEFEPTGEFRKRDWFEGTWGLAILGVTLPDRSIEEMDRDGLQYAVQVLRTPLARVRPAGPAAYDAWARSIGEDGQFAGKSPKELRDRQLCHACLVGVIAEGRAWGAPYLLTMAERHPAAQADLVAAADLADAQHGLMWDIWNTAGGIGFGDEKARILSDPAIRQQILPLIAKAKENDQRMADCLEQAHRRA